MTLAEIAEGVSVIAMGVATLAWGMLKSALIAAGVTLAARFAWRVVHDDE